MDAGDRDEVLRRTAANCAGAYRVWAERMGRPFRLWDDLSVGDLGLPAALPPNNATLLRPLTDGELPDVLERVDGFFSTSPGGGYQLWSIWETPDLSGEGFGGGSAPCMIREPGGEPGPAPPELTVVEAADEDTVREAATLIDTVFGGGRSEPADVLTPGVLGEDFRVWVGSVDGRPVSTAMAFLSDGFVGVYAVATAEDARGRGYGQALSWAATMCRPDLPATLQASAMGRPVYERMGYRTVARFTIWTRERGSTGRDGHHRTAGGT